LGSRTSSPAPGNPVSSAARGTQQASFYDTALAWADTNTPFLPIIAVVKSGLMVVIGTSSQQMNSVEVDNWFSLPIVLGLRNATRAD
jgi:hypothetical protein